MPSRLGHLGACLTQKLAHHPNGVAWHAITQARGGPETLGPQPAESLQNWADRARKTISKNMIATQANRSPTEHPDIQSLRVLVHLHLMHLLG